MRILEVFLAFDSFAIIRLEFSGFGFVVFKYKVLEEEEKPTSDLLGQKLGEEAKATSDLMGQKLGEESNTTLDQMSQKLGEESNTTLDLMGQKSGEATETTSDLMGQKSVEETNTTSDLMGQKSVVETKPTSDLMGQKLEEETNTTSDLMGQKLTTREKLAKNSNDSSMQIQRYIRLTELCPKFLQWTDEKFIPFQGAVELSYLTLEEQELVVFAMENLNCSVTLAQSKKLREKGNLVNLTDEVIDEILQEPFVKEKKTTLKLDTKKYFPENTSKKEMEEVIEGLLKEWKRENAKRVT